MSEAIAKELATKTIEIATLPEVTIKIIQVVQDPRSTAHDLHAIVANDPALSARVLRVVNSAFYGLPGQIGSLDRAIMLLGLNAIKNIAIAASLAKLFKQNISYDDFNGKDLWTHSVAVGATNKLITTAIGLTLPDEAFLAGLIHDLGLVALIQTQREKLPKILDLWRTGISFRRAEEEIIGADHQEVGKSLAARWKFPRSFQYVTGYHHDPETLAKENRLLAVVTHISDILCARMGHGLRVTAESEDVNPTLLDEIRILPAQLDELSLRIEDELKIVHDMID